MKIKETMLILGLFISQWCFSQPISADAILGKYVTANNEGIVEVTKRNAKYYGKLIWIRPNANLDLNNPDELERKKSLRGKEILKDHRGMEGVSCTWCGAGLAVDSQPEGGQPTR